MKSEAIKYATPEENEIWKSLEISSNDINTKYIIKCSS